MQDYILDRCVVRNKEANELTKPTGTKFVYVLQLDDDADAEQQALCVPTNPATLDGIYRIRNVKEDGNTAAQPTLPATATLPDMQDVTTRQFCRSQGTTSLARMMASANKEGFPLTDREFDSDSDDSDGSEGPPSAPYIQNLDAIAEEDEDVDDGFVDVVDYEALKYCHDPHFTGHPECHGRHKTDSYGHNAVDAELDFQERFVATHNGGDSIAHYRNWRILKWDYGETMVHGTSALRNEVAQSDSVEESEDTAERLVRQLAAKYGPLTLQGQSSSRPAWPDQVQCFDECVVKINKFLDEDVESDPRLPSRASVNGGEDIASEPNSLFDGVADLSVDVELAPLEPLSRTGPLVSEETLEKILNTPHEDFIEHYVQRQRARVEQAVCAKRSRGHSGRDLILANSTTKIPEMTATNVLKDVKSQLQHAVPAPEPMVTSLTEDPPLVLPLLINDEVGLINVPMRPVGALNSRSSYDGSSLRTSVFSKRASVATKPSTESISSDYSGLIDALDINAQVRSRNETSAVASSGRRVVRMPVSTSSAPEPCGTSSSVSALDQAALGHHITVAPSTPVRDSFTVDNGLSPIIDVQTPLQSFTMPLPLMQDSNLFDDHTGTLAVPIEEQLSDIGAWIEGVHQSQEQEPATTMQPSHSPVVDEVQPTTKHQRWSSKTAAGIKHRAHAVAGTTKRATRRFLRFAKKLRTTVRYLPPVAVATCNPYEAIALA